MLEPRLLNAVLASAGRVFVGYSGGVDSTVLLRLVRDWCVAAGRVGPIALHVDHGLQEASSEWLRHCRYTCEQWGLQLRSERLCLAQGASEAAARRGRYAYFSQQLVRGDDVLLLAHHQDDQLETSVVRMLQGRGVYAMPPQRRLGQGRLERPLLAQPRRNLLAYADKLGLEWVEDSSNAGEQYLRNRVRHRTLPGLRRLDTAWPGRVLQLAHTSERLWSSAQSTLRARSSRRLAVALLTHPEPAMTLRAWLRTQGEYQVTDKALVEYCRQLRTAPQGQGALTLATGQLRYYRDHVYFLKHRGAMHSAETQEGGDYLRQSYLVPNQQGSYRLPHGRLVVAARLRGASMTDLAAHPTATSAVLPVGFYAPVAKKRWQQLGVPSWLRKRYPRILLQGKWVPAALDWGDDATGAPQATLPGTAEGRFRWSPD